MNTLILVGADKGGVGKTTVARALLDFCSSKGILWRAIDTETPAGVLATFHPKAEIIDITKSDGQMSVFDNLKKYPVTLLDVRAGEMTNLLHNMATIGLNRVKELRILLLHVVGSSAASLKEIQQTAALVDHGEHFLIVNHANDATFAGLTPALQALVKARLDIPELDERAYETVDSLGMSFEAYRSAEEQSFVLKGWTSDWLSKVYAEFEKLELV